MSTTLGLRLLLVLPCWQGRSACNTNASPAGLTAGLTSVSQGNLSRCIDCSHHLPSSKAGPLGCGGATLMHVGCSHACSVTPCIHEPYNC